MTSRYNDATSTWTRDQVDELNGYFSKRNILEVLDAHYLRSRGIDDSRLEKLIEKYETAHDEIRAYLKSLGLNPPHS